MNWTHIIIFPSNTTKLFCSGMTTTCFGLKKIIIRAALQRLLYKLCMYVCNSVQHVVSLLFVSLCYFIITRLTFLILFLYLLPWFVFLSSILYILCFCIVLCTVPPFAYSCLFPLFLKFADHSHRVETQLLSNIISYHIIYHIISYHIISYRIISYITSYIICHHILCHIISYIISYNIVSYCILLQLCSLRELQYDLQSWYEII
jgi:hypothetical protein